MPRMIPEVPREGANESERRVFRALQDLQGRDNWIVFHSLDIAKHVLWWKGEADFVVVIPERGVVVVEVKAPSRVEYRNGDWTLHGTPSPKKNPLRQLDGAIASIREHLAQHGFIAGSMPITRLLWFTTISRTAVADLSGDLQFEPWELAWRDDFAAVGSALESALARRTVLDRTLHRHAADPTAFDLQTATRVADALVVQFVAVASVDDQHRDRVIREQALIDDQVEALDHVDSNLHLALEGAAGTGKSYLLAAAARRFAERGLATMVTCANVLMASEIRQLVGDDDRIDVLDLNALMLSVCEQHANPPGADNAWFREELPNRALARLREHPHLGDYQAICVDEFQDIAVEPRWIEVIAALAEGSIADVPVVIAGDDHQAIMRPGELGWFEVAGALFPDLVRVRLTRNCRMAPDLAHAAEEYAGFAFGFKGHRVPQSTPGALHLESAGDDPVTALADALRRLLDLYPADEVVVLSPYGNASTVGRLLADDRRDRDATWLRKQLARDGGAGRIRWHSIAKFKGCEAEAVVITDLGPAARGWVEGIGVDYADLVYVGVTRAKYRCVVLEAE